MVDAIECSSEIDTSAFNNPELFQLYLRDNILSRICVSMPCKIVSYNRATHIAKVKPLFNFKYENGPTVESAEMQDVEVRRIMAGGFLIDFPIAAGDTGWLIAVDRDASDIKERSGSALPCSSAVNTYVSGFWIPDQWGSDTRLGISGVDENRLVVQSKDGTQKISVGSSDIKITATTVTIDSPTTTITGAVNITGAVTMANALTVAGLTTCNGDVKNAAGTSLTTHKHTDPGPSPIPGT